MRDSRVGEPPLVAVGILSAPPFTSRRHAIRRTWLAERSTLRSVAACFVVRAGLCGRTSEAALRERSVVAAEAAAHGDVLALESVCLHERRARGAVFALYAWMQHAVDAYPHAAFIAKADDDVWLDLLTLRTYLSAISRALPAAGAASGVSDGRGAHHVLIGAMGFTSLVVSPTREWTHAGLAFGFDCGQAHGRFKRYIPRAQTHSARTRHCATVLALFALRETRVCPVYGTGTSDRS